MTHFEYFKRFLKSERFLNENRFHPSKRNAEKVVFIQLINKANSFLSKQSPNPEVQKN